MVVIAETTPDATLKVDTNQSWLPKETARFADRVAGQGVRLVLVEQPVPRRALAGLAATRERADIPIADDEAVFTRADAVVQADAADVINVKLEKSGSLAVADIARAAKLELMVSCMLESAIGIHTSAHVVSGIGEFDCTDLD